MAQGGSVAVEQLPLSGAKAAKPPSKRDKLGGKQQLFRSVFAYVRENGVGDVTLRQLAAAVGTSHRMLLYHFQSKEGLLLELVRAIEANGRQILENLGKEDHLKGMDRLRRFWALVTQPELAPQESLFWEMCAKALQGHAHSSTLLETFFAPWFETFAQIFRESGVAAGDAYEDARLYVALSRGLLLDLLATGDREQVNRAHERFLRHYEIAPKRTKAKAAY